MASTHSADKSQPQELVHDSRSGSDYDGKTEHDPEEARASIPNEKTEEAKKAEPSPPPDGGLSAWLVVVGAWCCSFSSPGWINSVGSIQQYYEVGPLKNYSSSTISWIPSFQLFFLFFLGPAVGMLYDNYGPRPIIIAGTFLHVFGLMMASLATKYYQFFLAQGVCSAIGVAFIYQPALACMTTYFAKKRGAALGIVTTGSSVGGVIFPIMLTRLIYSIGYPWAIRTAAFIILGLQLIAIFTVRPRIPPVPKKMPAGRLTAPFREPKFLLMLVGVFVLTFGIFMPILYLAVSGFQEAHMSEEMAQYLISIFNGASLFGRLTSGFGADIIGKWNMFVIACFLSGVAEFAVWIPAKTPAIAIGFAVFFGFSSGAFIGLSPALPISVSPLPEIGYRMGVLFLVISIPALTLGPIGGAILQSSANGWLAVKVFGGVLSVAGSAIVLLSRYLYTDKKFLKVF